MAGIYIHIPFCRQACSYCNFHFSTNQSYRHRMIEAILKEIKLESENLLSATIDSIYFGGGTPSIIEPDYIAKLIEQIAKSIRLSDSAEITLEVNPEDVSRANAGKWILAGVNRLSIGIQSFSDDTLKFMNRAHDAGMAVKALDNIFSSGFENVSADLIYGTPGTTLKAWEVDLEKLLKFPLKHLSAYALTVEPKTLLENKIRKKQIQSPPEELIVDSFDLLVKKTEAEGYEHYEISNFAKVGFRAVHNSSYWAGIPYRGFGPSAHSFTGYSRRWNIQNNFSYMKEVENAGCWYKEEELSEQDQFNEYIMTRLRIKEGIDLYDLNERFDSRRIDQLLSGSRKFEKRGFIECKQNRLKLTESGKLYADGIASELFQL
jgi:oxygen-independent coproporphyrinogen III oxidase